jgi:transposase
LGHQRGKARALSRRLKGLFRQAMDLWHDYPQGKRTRVAAHAQQLQPAIPHPLRDRPLKDPDNQRRLTELGWHNDRGTLRRFRDEPRLEPTNNRAERALRPAVIARKVSQCSKTPGGAQAFAAFPSIVRTLAKSGAEAIVE